MNAAVHILTGTLSDVNSDILAQKKWQLVFFGSDPDLMQSFHLLPIPGITAD